MNAIGHVDVVFPLKETKTAANDLLGRKEPKSCKAVPECIYFYWQERIPISSRVEQALLGEQNIIKVNKFRIHDH